jgi:transposase
VPDATFACPDLTKFCRLDELGLEVTGQRLDTDRAVLACRVVEPDAWWRPTTLEVTIRRYRCIGCGHVRRQDTSQAAEPRAKLSRRGLRWALEGIVVGHLMVARVAEGLGVAWNTANDAVLTEGKRILIDDPHRFDGVRVVGVDEHVWRHTRRGDKYVPVIIDLPGIRDGTGPARLLDMVEGGSEQAFKTRLAERPQAWRDGVEVVAMDGFTGFKTATTEELPDAVAVMDPFHVVRLGGDALDRCRRRGQQAIHGHRGRKDDPLYRARRTLHTGAGLLTDKQKDRLSDLFATEEHVQVQATWGIYQRMIAAYREPDRAKGRELMVKLSEIITLGRTAATRPCRRSRKGCSTYASAATRSQKRSRALSTSRSSLAPCCSLTTPERRSCPRRFSHTSPSTPAEIATATGVRRRRWPSNSATSRSNRPATPSPPRRRPQAQAGVDLPSKSWRCLPHRAMTARGQGGFAGRRNDAARERADRDAGLPVTDRQSVRVRRLSARVGIITVAATRCSPRRAVVVAVSASERRGGTNEIAVSVTAVRTNRSAGRALQ